jgi:hypothetical protein
MINDEYFKVFKIKGNGKKGKYRQSGSNQVADPKQSFETATVKPNGDYKKDKKSNALKETKPAATSAAVLRKK